jgi:Proteasome maturation factor UMP1
MKFRLFISLRVPCRSIISRHHHRRHRPPAHQDGLSPPQEKSLTVVVKRTPDIPSILIQPNNPQTKQGLKLCPRRPRYPRLWPLLHRHHSQRPTSTRITSQELGCTTGTVEVGVGQAIRRNRRSDSHWHGEDDCQQCMSSTSRLSLASSRELIREQDFRPVALGGPSNIHLDIINGKDTKIDIEDIYNGIIEMLGTWLTRRH